MREYIFFWGQKLIERGAWFLAPLSWVWALVSFFKNWLYDHRWLKSTSVPCAVVSVGNIVAGGTGKTPFVHLLAKTFKSKKVAILSRGYSLFADEAALLKRRLPQVKIYIGKDRVALAKQAVLEGAELIILDDGFQYRKLFRDIDIVLLDGDDPFGKGHYLPWGYLRDSPKRIQTADFVFVNGQDIKLKLSRILDFQEKQIETIKNRQVGIFSGIAKPSKWRQTVLDLRAEIVAEWTLVDHAMIPLSKLAHFAETSQKLGATDLLCTEKDFVRLKPSLELKLPILFLEMEMEVQSHQIWENLIAKISQKIDNYSSYGQRNKN
jgi:tetraacyldisaccharide 4'-kinase